MGIAALNSLRKKSSEEPQWLKPIVYANSSGTTEVVPFHKNMDRSAEALRHPKPGFSDGAAPPKTVAIKNLSCAPQERYVYDTDASKLRYQEY